MTFLRLFLISTEIVKERFIKQFGHNDITSADGKEKDRKNIWTFPGNVVSLMDEESISTLFLQHWGQNVCDKPTKFVLSDHVHVLRPVDHVGVVHPLVCEVQRNK